MTGKICETVEVRTRDEQYISIQPIQVGGKLTVDAMKALISYGDGYSVCDLCRKPFRLDKIEKPNIRQFHEDLAEFVNMDKARVVPGARRGFQAVVSTFVERGDPVMLTELGHYTEYLAIENAGGIPREIPASGDKVITAEAAAGKIEEVKKETGKLPKLIMVDHFDYSLANEHDVKGIGKIAKEYDIPFMYNGAYTVGIMPVDGKKIGADFVVGSGHKSMASPAPVGVLAGNGELVEKVFRKTNIEGDISKRRFGVKEVEMMGCTVMGAPIIGMMASFPHVKERVKNWDKEVEHSRYFIEQFMRISGNKVISEMPRKHTLSKVNTSETFDKVAKTHKKRGFFFSHELKEKRIVGIFEGATRSFKLNVYGLSDENIKYLADAFIDIASKYKLPIN